MMTPHTHAVPSRRGVTGLLGWSRTPRVTPGALDLVTAREMETLCRDLAQGRIPLDLQAKVSVLRVDDPMEFFLKRQSELLLAFLMAPEASQYCRIRPDDCRRLLRMLAYVRKDDDAIPDTCPGGFVDDHDLMRMTCRELDQVLDAFKAWHLSRRVALLWNGSAGSEGLR